MSRCAFLYYNVSFGQAISTNIYYILFIYKEVYRINHRINQLVFGDCNVSNSSFYCKFN